MPVHTLKTLSKIKIPEIARSSILNMEYRKFSIKPPGFIHFKHSRGGLIGVGAYKREGLINVLKIFNSSLNICRLKIEKTMYIV